MSMIVNQIIERVNKVFCDVLEDESIVVKYETVADDVDDWDSLNHIMLVVGIESEFSISFTSSEVHGFENVGQMCESIKLKLDSNV